MYVRNTSHSICNDRFLPTPSTFWSKVCQQMKNKLPLRVRVNQVTVQKQLESPIIDSPFTSMLAMIMASTSMNRCFPIIQLLTILNCWFLPSILHINQWFLHINQSRKASDLSSRTIYDHDFTAGSPSPGSLYFGAVKGACAPVPSGSGTTALAAPAPAPASTSRPPFSGVQS